MSTTEQCCDSASVATKKKHLSLIRGLAIFLGLIGSFLISDYWLGTFLSHRLSSFSVKVQDSLSFFVAHSIGLISLLAAITTLAVFSRSFIDPEKVRQRMSKINTFKGHGLAAGIGVATPFCSCSAVPVFTGFVRSGVPVSQAISFLVASPLVNEIAVFLLAASVSWSIAGLYAALGFGIAVFAGLVLSRIATPAWTEVTPVRSLNLIMSDGRVQKPTLEDRMQSALLEAKDTVKTTFVYILIGVSVGSVIHGWVPITAIEKIVSWGPVFGVLAATAIGVPLYSGIATVIPIITALSEKGMPMGTLLAFAMSVTALSLPEALLLRKVLKPRLLFSYFATVSFGIILVGIIFNIIL